MTARLALTAQAEDLIDAYAAELAAAGATVWPADVGGARAFCARYPSPATFSARPVEEQVRLPGHQRRFACWLMVTGRMSVSAQFLARADLRLGVAAARYYPALHTCATPWPPRPSTGACHSRPSPPSSATAP